MADTPIIRRLAPANTVSAAPELAALLLDAVRDGASVGFMADLAQTDAEAYWHRLAANPEGRIVLVVDDADGVAGVVVLVPNPNGFQPHRAEIAKMVVHRRARGQGFAKALMGAAELEALGMGRTLLTLMTRHGSESEQMYRKLGWTLVGVIPGDSLQPDGTLCDGAIYYKRLVGLPRPCY